MAYGACDGPDAGYAARISYVIGPGPDRTIRAAYDKVDAADHPQQVLDAL